MISEKYRSILLLPHHRSDTHPPMDRISRAAQFSPFSALVGYDDMIDETNRSTSAWSDSGEDDNAELDKKMQVLLDNIDLCPSISVTYFVPDGKKQGGRYVTVVKSVRRVDTVLRKIHFTDKTELSLSCVTDLSGELFERTGMNE